MNSDIIIEQIPGGWRLSWSDKQGVRQIRGYSTFGEASQVVEAML